MDVEEKKKEAEEQKNIANGKHTLLMSELQETLNSIDRHPRSIHSLADAQKERALLNVLDGKMKIMEERLKEYRIFADSIQLKSDNFFAEYSEAVREMDELYTRVKLAIEKTRIQNDDEEPKLIAKRKYTQLMAELTDMLDHIEPRKSKRSFNDVDKERAHFDIMDEKLKQIEERIKEYRTSADPIYLKAEHSSVEYSEAVSEINKLYTRVKFLVKSVINYMEQHGSRLDRYEWNELLTYKF